MSAALDMADAVMRAKRYSLPRRNIFTAKGLARIAMVRFRPQPAILYAADDLPNPYCPWRKVYGYAIGPVKPIQSVSEEGVIQIPKASMAAQILHEVLEKYGLTDVQIRTRRRFPAIVAAKAECCWRLRDEVAWTLPQIAKFMGYSDHTSAMHMCRRHSMTLAGKSPQVAAEQGRDAAGRFALADCEAAALQRRRERDAKRRSALTDEQRAAIRKRQNELRAAKRVARRARREARA